MGVPVSKPANEDESACVTEQSSMIQEAKSQIQEKKQCEVVQQGSKEAVLKPPVEKGCSKTKKHGGLGHMARWEDMFSRLLKFYQEHGHCLVPNRYAEDPKLGTWVATQRRQYKVLMSGSTESTQLTPQRAMRLQELGFSWSPKESDSWDGFYKEYVDFVGKYGNNKVAKLLGADSPLTKWESSQRQEYALMKKGSPSRLTPSRIEKLTDIGFNWGEEKKTNNSLSLPIGASSAPFAKPSVMHHVSNYYAGGGGENPQTKKRTRELQQQERERKERELEIIVKALAQQKQSLDQNLPTGTNTSPGLDIVSGARLQTFNQHQQQPQVKAQQPEASLPPPQLFSAGTLPLNAFQTTAMLGTLHTVQNQNSLHNLQNSVPQHLLQQNPFQNPLQCQLQSPIQQYPQYLQSIVIPSSSSSSLHGQQQNAQAVHLTSLDRNVVVVASNGGPTHQGETEATPPPPPPPLPIQSNFLLPQCSNNHEGPDNELPCDTGDDTALRRDEADSDTAERSTKRCKYFK